MDVKSPSLHTFSFCGGYYGVQSRRRRSHIPRLSTVLISALSQRVILPSLALIGGERARGRVGMHGSRVSVISLGAELRIALNPSY